MFCGIARKEKHVQAVALRIPLVLLACAALSAMPCVAQEGDFRVAVELVVFLQLDPQASTEDLVTHPPDLPAPRYFPAPQELPDLGPETPEPPPGVLALSRAQYGLAGVWDSMRRSAGYRPLAHFAWAMPKNWNGEPIPIQLSNLSASELPFTGVASLEEERFVHLTLDLRMPAETGGKELLQLAERRRLLLGEMHYFDHPRFGAIARLFRYRPRPAEED